MPTLSQPRECNCSRVCARFPQLLCPPRPSWACSVPQLLPRHRKKALELSSLLLRAQQVRRRGWQGSCGQGATKRWVDAQPAGKLRDVSTPDPSCVRSSQSGTKKLEQQPHPHGSILAAQVLVEVRNNVALVTLNRQGGEGRPALLQNFATSTHALLQQ